jgi:uncharacterized protein (DUF58 family)
MKQDDAFSRLLEPEALARVHALRLQATQTVDGLLMGLHRSPHHGSSVEFAEHKQYAPGDEIRHIDWRVYAKSDKFYVKRFEQETNMRAMLLCDASASMLYSSPQQRTKYDYAASLAASFGYILLRQQDAVGLMVADTETRTWVPPRARSSHLTHLCEVLVANTPEKGAQTDLTSAVERLSEVFENRGPVFVFSDFLDTTRRWVEILRQMESRRQHVTLFQVLDPWELTFPFDEMTAFRSLETGRKILAEPRAMREAYIREIQAFIAELRVMCLEAGMSYRMVTTDTPLSEALASYLSMGDGGSQSLGATNDGV